MIKKIGLFFLIASSFWPNQTEGGMPNLQGNGPFSLHHGLFQGASTALHQEVPLEKIYQHFNQILMLTELSTIFVSWRLAQKNPESYKRSLDELRTLASATYPDETRQCNNLIAAVSKLCAGQGTEATFKGKTLSVEEKKAAEKFHAQIHQTIKKLLEQKKDLQEILNFIEQSFNCDLMQQALPALEEQRPLFQTILKAHKLARKNPSMHRKFLAQLLDTCIKKNPNRREACRTATSTYAMILCGDPEEKLIRALDENYVQKYETNDLTTYIPRMEEPKLRLIMQGTPFNQKE